MSGVVEKSVVERCDVLVVTIVRMMFWERWRGTDESGRWRQREESWCVCVCVCS